ncbi:MAG TPA: peptide deformylase [bacterium]|nr:peptide deformylase [bacterium]
MSCCEVVKIGHLVLCKETRMVSRRMLGDPELKKIIQVMVATMRRMKGVGLAANQIGLNLRVIVLECRANPRYPRAHDFPLEVWINPEITKYSKKKEMSGEGCLSIPGYRGLVPRSRSVSFEAWTPQGKKIKRTVRGFHARVIQHEVDHLNGFFYIDRMKNFRSWMHLDEFNRMLKLHIRDR